MNFTSEVPSCQASDHLHWFILQAMDRDLDYPRFETRFSVRDLSVLREILGPDADDDPNITSEYELDQADVASINAIFGIAFDPAQYVATLTPWHTIRAVPYLVHTGFELPLMLERRKPLSAFYDAFPCDHLDGTIARFEPFVAQGLLSKFVIETPLSDDEKATQLGARFQGFRRVYYTLPREEWRAKAHHLMWETGKKSGWNAALERIEGSLLGYDDDQSDWWAVNSPVCAAWRTKSSF